MPRMLIIDDNVEFKTMISCFFTDLGFSVEQADGGRDGLAKVRTVKPDVILLDVMMPDMGGIEVIRELQADDEMKAIPVLVITGSHFEGNMKDLFKQESNCREFLSKTVELTMLQAKVELLLKKPK